MLHQRANTLVRQFMLHRLSTILRLRRTILLLNKTLENRNTSPLQANTLVHQLMLLPPSSMLEHQRIPTPLSTSRTLSPRFRIHVFPNPNPTCRRAADTTPRRVNKCPTER